MVTPSAMPRSHAFHMCSPPPYHTPGAASSSRCNRLRSTSNRAGARCGGRGGGGGGGGGDEAADEGRIEMLTPGSAATSGQRKSHTAAHLVVQTSRGAAAARRESASAASGAPCLRVTQCPHHYTIYTRSQRTLIFKGCNDLECNLTTTGSMQPRNVLG